MTLDVLAAADTISSALHDLTTDIAQSVVLVRGSMGGSGCGVIWNQPGLVITNHHVVPGRSAELTVAGGRRLVGRVIRRAPALDLAALQVDGELPPGVRVGDSDALRVGDLVLAVGNPMGERNAPSLGIIASTPHEVLRLSITLRPGNSGGALVNARGEVVGIPHMVTGSGLALAVATSTVRAFLQGADGERPGDRDQDGLRWI
ncbi:MAG TPA: trypsin-like peptidase domain-containing protein [Chloroflexota bacterium]|jgi:serine protease Do|nr:trypsin-like peptidase domain-containing protein [Chloroflexota bacterium]